MVVVNNRQAVSVSQPCLQGWSWWCGRAVAALVRLRLCCGLQSLVGCGFWWLLSPKQPAFEPSRAKTDCRRQNSRCTLKGEPEGGALGGEWKGMVFLRGSDGWLARNFASEQCSPSSSRIALKFEQRSRLGVSS